MAKVFVEQEVGQIGQRLRYAVVSLPETADRGVVVEQDVSLAAGLGGDGVTKDLALLDAHVTAYEAVLLPSGRLGVELPDHRGERGPGSQCIPRNGSHPTRL
jgi:hypothetical protein